MWGTNEFRAAALRFERALRLFRAATQPAAAPGAHASEGEVNGVVTETPAAPDPRAERQTKVDELLRQAAETDDHGRRSALIAEAVRLHMDGDGGQDDSALDG